jgi:hypothetical protein
MDSDFLIIIIFFRLCLTSFVKLVLSFELKFNRKNRYLKIIRINKGGGHAYKKY